MIMCTKTNNNDSRKHNNEKRGVSFFRHPSDVIPTNFGNKSKIKLL